MTGVTRWQDAVVSAGAEVGFRYLRDMASDTLEAALPVLRHDKDLLAVARASSTANLALVLSIVRGEVTMREIDPPPQAIAFTRELARRNVPVTELERGYRVVQRRMWRWAISELRARISDPATLAVAIEQLTDASFTTGDLLSRLVMQRYAEERDRWVRSAEAVRAVTVDALLDGAVDAVAASRRLTYELEQQHEAFLAWADDEDAVPETAAAAVGGPRALLVPRGVGLIAGWAPAGTLELGADTGGACIAIGQPAFGPRGFRLSHQQALEARRVARSRRPAPSLLRYQEVARVALLTRDPELASEFVHRVLGPLAVDDEPTRRLAETLFVVLEEHGSPRRAGRRLGLHENTVAKRLRAVDAMLDPGARAGASDLLAALTIRLGDRPGPV